MKTKIQFPEDDQIQMTSFMDCVFLLLIFFLVTATMKKAHKELEIQLPHSAAAKETKSKYDTIVIEITKDGKIYLEQDEMTQQTLHKRLRAMALANPMRRVRLDVDRRAAFQYLVHVIDLCQYENLNVVGMHTRD